jgi:hypothetical protein
VNFVFSIDCPFLFKVAARVLFPRHAPSSKFAFFSILGEAAAAMGAASCNDCLPLLLTHEPPASPPKLLAKIRICSRTYFYSPLKLYLRLHITMSLVVWMLFVTGLFFFFVSRMVLRRLELAVGGFWTAMVCPRWAYPQYISPSLTTCRETRRSTTTILASRLWWIQIVRQLSRLNSLLRAFFKLNIHSIIAVHGLDGHRRTSWTANNGVLWLRDLLPSVIPGARVLTYGYNHSCRP